MGEGERLLTIKEVEDRVILRWRDDMGQGNFVA